MASLNSPCVVHLHDIVDGSMLDITPQVGNVVYSNSDPGGFRDCQIPLNRPLALPPRHLAAFSHIKITHGRNGSTLWEGQMQDPDRGGGPGGPIWDLKGIGYGPAQTKDVTAPYIGIDAALSSWVPAPLITSTQPQAQIQNQVQGNVGACLAFSMPPAVVRPGGSPNMAAARHLALLTSGQSLGTVTLLARASYTSADHAMDLGEVLSVGATTNWIGTSNTTLDIDAVTDGPWSTAVAAVRWVLNTTPYTTTDDDYCYFGTIAVRPLIVNKAGTPIAANTYVKTYVTTAEILGDLLGGDRMPLIDGANSTIQGGTHQIKHLAYTSGVTVATIFEDMMKFEGGYSWFVWEKRRLSWVPAQSVPRYEMDADVDTFRASGSNAELYNRCRVRFTDEFGDEQSLVVSRSVPALDDKSMIRTYELDLGTEVGITFDEAQIAGDNFLDEHSYPVRGGTVTIGRPIRDKLTGRQVDPSEIRSGSLVVMRNVDPTFANMSPTGSNGLTAFRMASATHDANAGATTCELGQFTRSVERQIAENARRLSTIPRA